MVGPVTAIDCRTVAVKRTQDCFTAVNNGIGKMTLGVRLCYICVVLLTVRQGACTRRRDESGKPRLIAAFTRISLLNPNRQA